MSGQDPMADIQTLTGWSSTGPGISGGLVGQNPYLTYQGAIPMAGYYTGQNGDRPPTNAAGRPIAGFVNWNNNAQADYQTALADYNAQQAQQGQQSSQPGTTLNSMPNVYGTSTPNLSQGIYSALPASGGMTLPDSSQYSAATQSALAQYPGGIPLSAFAGGTGGGNQNQQDAAGLAALMGLNPQNLNGMSSVYAAQPAATASSGSTPPSPPDTRQAYLDALANPGWRPIYGAAPPQPGQTATGSTQQPSVIQAFLAAHPTASTGANGYSNAGFLSTLKQLGG